MAKLSELIEAMNIFLKYSMSPYPMCCEHDVLHVGVNSNEVSKKDKKRLEELGFVPGEEYDDFISFRYGSA